ncbi:unnamed protein product, partial [Rotaria socialis]
VGHLLVFFAIALYVGLTVNRARNYVSLIGIFTLVLLGTIGSKHPHRVGRRAVSTVKIKHNKNLDPMGNNILFVCYSICVGCCCHTS